MKSVEIIKATWDFVTKFYPNYSSSDEIARNEDLSKLLSGEYQEGDIVHTLLLNEYDGDSNNDQIRIDFNSQLVKIYEASIEAFIKSQSVSPEVKLVDENEVVLESLTASSAENKIQSMSFEFRGLVINRRIASETQSVFDIKTWDGDILVQGFDGNAEYDKKAMCNVCNDGRKNIWMKTDWEIKLTINSFLELGHKIGQGKLVDSVLKNVKY